MNFKKFQSKWKIVKHFTRPKQRVTFKKLPSLLQTHPHRIKCYYVFGKKISYGDIQKYTEYLLSKYLQFLGVTKWCCANVFSDTEQKHVFWLYYESILFSMSSESRSVIWVMFFEWNCIVRWAIFFPSFCWLWDFLLQNLKWKRNSKDVRWYIWANTNNMRMPEIIFSKKRITNVTFWIIYILVHIQYKRASYGPARSK